MIAIYILLVCMVLFFAGLIGYGIAVNKFDRNLDDIQKDLDQLTNRHNNFVKLSRQAIESADNCFQLTYDYLVRLRNEGTENLDELIGYLGEALDDHKED